MGACEFVCEFVMRLLARVTGEKSEAMYVCGFDAVGGRFPCLKGKKDRKETKKNFQGRVPKELSILGNFSCSSPDSIENREKLT